MIRTTAVPSPVTLLLAALLATVASPPAHAASSALHDAAKAGDRAAVEAALGAGTDVNATNVRGETALHVAALSGNSDVVELLLSRGADINVQDPRYQQTPLHMAAYKRRHEAMRALLGAKPDLERRDKLGNTPLFAAVYAEDDKGAALLLDAGAGVNGAGESGERPVQRAVRQRPPTVLKLLLERGADANAANDQGATALMDASFSGRLDAARLLLDHGADVNRQRRDGHTALMSALRGNAWNPALVELLLARGADPNLKTSSGEDALMKLLHFQNVYANVIDHFLKHAKTLAPERRAPFELMQAAQRGDAAAVTRLAKAGVPLDDDLRVGVRALCNAAGQGHVEVARALKAAGVDVGGAPGRTCLPRAANFSRWEVFEYLLDEGANPSEDQRPKDLGGNYHRGDALSSALGARRDDLVRKVIRAGYSIRPDKDGQFRILLTAATQKLETLQWLYDEAARVGGKPPPLEAALRTAAYWGFSENVRWMIERGVDLGAKDRDGHTALDGAYENNRFKVVRLLWEAGAPGDPKKKREHATAAALLGDEAAFFASLKGLSLQGELGRRLLIGALSHDKPAIAEGLLDRGVKLEWRAPRLEYTALHEAADLRRGAAPAIELLLARGANLAARDELARTAMGIAAHDGRLESIAVLAKHGAGIEEAIEARDVASSVAKRGDVKLLVALLDGYGCDGRCHLEQDALRAAAAAGKLDVVEALLARGVPATREERGRSPLSLAAEKGHAEVIRALLAGGADPCLLDGHGRTPLDVAEEHQRSDAAAALIASPKVCDRPVDPRVAFKVEQMYPRKRSTGVLNVLPVFDVRGVVLAENVTLRHGPFANDQTKGKLAHGTEVEVLAYTDRTDVAHLRGRWFLVQAGEAQGFVFAQNIGRFVHGAKAAPLEVTPGDLEFPRVRAGSGAGGPVCEVKVRKEVRRHDDAPGAATRASVVMADLNMDAWLDPVCVFEREGSAHVCPFLSSGEYLPDFQPAGCVEVPAQGMPSISGKKRGRSLELVVRGKKTKKLRYDAKQGRYR